jgi:outer membrane protein OmpA-like peptidoglycan-associated protein
MKLRILALAITSMAFCAAAQAPAAAPADTAKAATQAVVPVKQGPADIIRNNVTELKSDLNGSYKEYTGKDSKVIESYLNALSRIEVTMQYVLANFTPGEPASLALRKKERKAREMFMACSLLAELAITQMNTDRFLNQLAALNAYRDSIDTEMAATYEKLIELERGKASELKGRLDAENERARQLREEMDKRFKELESTLIKVRKDARGTIVSMSDILFGFDKADVTQNLKTPLAKIAGILTVYKDCKVLVEGHTDNIGTADYNKSLSERRAVNVRDFLVEQGIGKDRLTAMGYGMTKPYVSNTTKEGRQKNRRVDLVIVDKK